MGDVPKQYDHWARRVTVMSDHKSCDHPEKESEWNCVLVRAGMFFSLDTSDNHSCPK